LRCPALGAEALVGRSGDVRRCAAPEWARKGCRGGRGGAASGLGADGLFDQGAAELPHQAAAAAGVV
jgi:hypothetical protein